MYNIFMIPFAKDIYIYIYTYIHIYTLISLGCKYHTITLINTCTANVGDHNLDVSNKELWNVSNSISYSVPITVLSY